MPTRAFQLRWESWKATSLTQLAISTDAAFLFLSRFAPSFAWRQRRRMQATHRNPVTLVLGGVRSGKSHYAQQFGERAQAVVFVATAQAYDDEMRHKIDRHRESRPASWQTVEEPLELAKTIEAHGYACDVMIVDCLTFFASNLLDASGDDVPAIESSVDRLCEALRSPPCSVVLVSNEVGSGVVPAFPSGRRFRDLLGEMNQKVARVASNVVLLVAGLPLALKGDLGASS
jgi:adenosylcobinamide kinase/adenosylcobinamide-phosphate guanylyltransferase